MSTTRKLQEIFNAVIDAGYYFSDKPQSQEYMCHALESAFDAGVINITEAKKAKQAIRTYIDKLTSDKWYPTGCIKTLSYALTIADLNSWRPNTVGDTAPNLSKIYQNWRKRPFPRRNPSWMHRN